MNPLRSLSALALAGAVALSAAAAQRATAAPPKAGDTAPGFSLIDQKGKRVTLSAARGRKVVLVFYRGYW